ncbi:rna polymerase i specific transcription initiation factor rrn7 [Pyrenophora seminiperda CCB06]|uniref:Rna polymerase i specific transcription initiation factor rrn7 n=1 Tax=Pyrenophora seminiperda CCB06 TaxID=1302712 RepID=A0A3M7M6S5_9PLEO|nr:rna polymerase i specific transcription initiation factor rrn7 [Pyrenophora seminiperda CCB06]
MKGPVCGIENCRSRRYEEGEDGYTYCQNGHQQVGMVRREDDDDYISAARTVTRRKKDVDDEDTPSRILNGPKALDLYLKSVQLILRYQIWFLVHDKGLPAELETVIYDLWTLRVAQLGEKIVTSDNPALESQSQQIFSTMESENDATDNEEEHLSSTKRKRGMRLSTAPNLTDCLALCYLGLVTLRLPFTPGDIYTWVTNGSLAYRRAIKLLPLAMRDQMPPGYRAILDPSAPLSYMRFYKTLTDLQISYSKDHGIIWPALNVPLLLFRYLRELALPLELYDAARRLGELLGYDFAPHYEGKKRLGIPHLPDAQLVSCIIVCVKLLYPLDGYKRYPQSSSDATSVVIDWDLWCEEMRASEERQPPAQDMAKLQEKDVLSMTPEEMDRYLDFYSDTYLDKADIERTSKEDAFSQTLYDMFPIENKNRNIPEEKYVAPSLRQKLDIVQAVHASMKTIPAVPDDDDDDARVLRPGQAYPLWKTEDDLPKVARMLYEKARNVAGLSMHMLMAAVGSTESKMGQWKKAQMRRIESEKAGQDDFAP